MEFGKPYWRSFQQGTQREWLLTNGLGGFASSTIIGANTRRYHGLLIAALQPPVSRNLVFSQVDESFVVENDMYELHSYQTPDYTSKGHLHLQHFKMDPVPTFIYSIRDILIEKRIVLVHGQNTVAVIYKIKNGSKPILFRLTPIVNCRDYHLNSRRSYMSFEQQQIDKGVRIKSSFPSTEFDLLCSEGKFIPYENCYFYNMYYENELERGLDPIDDHYIPGRFEMHIQPNVTMEFTMLGTLEKEITCLTGKEYIENEQARMEKVLKKSKFNDPFSIRLVKAADQFIVNRVSTHSKTIIAGYPWFTDWGRDTMISFTGLTLSTGRYEDAKEILTTFAKHIKYGLIPNVFSDYGKEPAYNNVDGALWFFEAVNQYLECTKDIDFVKEQIFQGLEDIIHAYKNGTEFKIMMDDDYLITAGDETTQLTWMDAKVGNWVVTPRHGKAVEINALWYNAVKITEKIAKQIGKPGDEFEIFAENIKQSFISTFWNEQKQCLFDVVNGENKDAKLRPNQVLAISLSYPIIEGEKAKLILQKLRNELCTSFGLRSLSQTEKEYRGIYRGDHYSRDGAYHQGTVWPWLLGHFIRAYLREFKERQETIEEVEQMLKPMQDHLEDACIGSISELFDGDEPLLPRGCFAQAWSVGEIIRVYTDFISFKTEKRA